MKFKLKYNVSTNSKIPYQLNNISVQTDLKCKKHNNTKTFEPARTTVFHILAPAPVSFRVSALPPIPTSSNVCMRLNSPPKAIHCCINLRSTALRETHALSPTPFASPQLPQLHLTICQLLGAPSGIVLPGCLASCGRPPKHKKEMVTARTGENAEGERECEREGVTDQLWEAIFPLL